MADLVIALLMFAVLLAALRIARGPWRELQAALRKHREFRAAKTLAEHATFRAGEMEELDPRKEWPRWVECPVCGSPAPATFCLVCGWEDALMPDDAAVERGKLDFARSGSALPPEELAERDGPLPADEERELQREILDANRRARAGELDWDVWWKLFRQRTGELTATRWNGLAREVALHAEEPLPLRFHEPLGLREKPGGPARE